MTSTQIPVHDYEVMRGDRLDFLVRYSPGGVPMAWSGASVQISVRGEEGLLIAIPESDITLVEPGELADEDAPNIIAGLSPDETKLLELGERNLYQVRVIDSEDNPRTALTGRITSHFSPIEGV